MGPASLIALPVADPRISLPQPLDKRQSFWWSDCRVGSDYLLGSWGPHGDARPDPAIASPLSGDL